MGCQSLKVTDSGPLAAGKDKIEICTPVGSSSQITYGFEAITIKNGSSLVVNDVSLVSEAGVKLSEVALLRVEGSATLAGTFVGWPPGGAIEGKRWQDRIAVPSEILRSEASQEVVYNVVVLLEKAARADASLRALRIDYEVDGVSYADTTATTAHFRGEC